MSYKQIVRHGQQEPRIKLEPKYAYTDGEDAGVLAAEFGLAPFPWQQTILNAWLGRDDDDRFTAKTCGLVVPRQNGKNAILEMRELYGLVILGETILHTAHRVDTCTKSFERLRGFFTDQDHYPELADMVAKIRNSNGRQSITLKNGGSVEFIARSRGASRGFTLDMAIMDESQELRDTEIEAILPTMGASELGNPQVIYTGTPPGPENPGDVFARTRKRALRNESSRLAWHEWGVEELGDIADADRWYETNPSLGYRVDVDYLEEEIDRLSEIGFAREHLGYWQEGHGKLAIEAKQWDRLATDEPPMDGLVGYGIKFAPDESVVALAACIRPNDRPPHVELVNMWDARFGTEELAEWLIERKNKAASIVIDGRSGCESLVKKLRDAKVSRTAYTVCGTREVIASCQQMATAIRERHLTHYAQDELDDSAKHVTKRAIGNDGGYGWAGFGAYISTPFEAATLALYGVTNTKRDPTRKVRLL